MIFWFRNFSSVFQKINPEAINKINILLLLLSITKYRRATTAYKKSYDSAENTNIK